LDLAAASLSHAVIPGLAAPLAVFAKSNSVLNFGAADGSLTDLMVLLVSPSEGAAHLRALAGIARRLREQKVREQLRPCSSRDCIYSVLIGHDDVCSTSSTVGQHILDGGSAPVSEAGPMRIASQPRSSPNYQLLLSCFSVMVMVLPLCATPYRCQ
jgi:hypothetical protein